MPRIRYLSIIFRNRLKPFELPAFRAAVIEHTNRESVLFHNHVGQGFRYEYPLIQYKVVNGHAAIICMDDGAEDIHHLMGRKDLNLRIGERTEKFEFEEILMKYHPIRFTDNPVSYSLELWNAFGNKENLARYAASRDDLETQAASLSRVLIGNIISMAKAIQWDVKERILVSDMEVLKETWIPFKGIAMPALNVEFKINLNLPPYIGLGKGTSLGYGLVRPMNGNALADSPMPSASRLPESGDFPDIHANE